MTSGTPRNIGEPNGSEQQESDHREDRAGVKRYRRTIAVPQKTGYYARNQQRDSAHQVEKSKRRAAQLLRRFTARRVPAAPSLSCIPK
jgi:hypothetical protein